MMLHHISTQCGRNAVWGLPQKNEVIPVNGDDLDFIFYTRDRLAAVWVPSLSLGGRGKPRSLRLRFRSAALTSFGRVYVFYSDMRQQVPKPMLERAFEGELLAFSVNGDRYVLAAVSPRRKPRTDFFPALALPPVNQLYLPT